jgi:hypothetical protein
VEQAAGALANLCFDCADNRDAVREAGGLDALVGATHSLPASPRCELSLVQTSTLVRKGYGSS